jgi:hypothetical protein
MTTIAEPVTFPYANMGEATKDKFKKIGGPDQALRFLKKGYKAVEWRKRTDAAAKAREEAEDAAFLAENPGAKL